MNLAKTNISEIIMAEKKVLKIIMAKANMVKLQIVFNLL